MDYNLIKQLKDAGYPLLDAENVFGGTYYPGYEIDGKRYIIPSLSELIKACLLKHCVFRLYCWEHGFVVGFQPEEKKDDMEICETPEEAMAKLYISLNK